MLLETECAGSRGDNGTGSPDQVELVGKRLNLLLELIPQATTIAYLSPPSGHPLFEGRPN
jgi:hypothetical protein